MPQILKEEIKDMIDKAALLQFYKKGYQKATMSDIAKEAGISTGNIYRYYHSKDELFYSAIPQSFINDMLSLIKTKLSSLNEMSIEKARFSSVMKLVDDQAVEFIIKHKMQIIVAVERSKGTKYENLKDNIRDMLIRNLREYIKHLGKKGFINDRIKNDILKIITANFIQAFLEIIKNYEKGNDLAHAYESLLEYHELGVNKFLG